MAGDAFRHQLDAARNFLRRLDGREPRLAANPGDAAALREAVLGLDLREVLADHELDAEAGIPLFTRFGQEDDIAIERHVLALQQHHRHQRGREVVLVVHRAAGVDVAAFARRAERRVLPLRRVDRDDVGVGHDEQRPLPAVALQPRDDVRPLRIEREDLRRDAFLVEHLLEVVDRQALVAGRIAGVEPQHRLKVLHDLVFERRSSRVRRAPASARMAASNERRSASERQRVQPGRPTAPSPSSTASTLHFAPATFVMMSQL